MSAGRTMARRARDELRTEVLDVAERLVAAGERPSMPELARRVGVSRQTLYSEFGDRDGLAAALVLRSTDRWLDRIEAALSGADDLHASWVAAVGAALTEAAHNPLVTALLTGAPTAFGRGSGPIVEAAATRAARWLRRVRPDLDDDDVELATQTAARLVVSHLVLPGGPSGTVAEQVATVVVRTLSVERTAAPGTPRAADAGTLAR